MQISETKQGSWIVLKLNGRLDHAGADELDRVLLPQMRGGAVALDFRGIDFISSAGFRVLMHAEREQHARHGRLLIGHLRDPVRQVFDLAGLSQHFQITHDLTAVIAQDLPLRRQ